MTKPELEDRVKHLERQRSRWYTAAASRRKWLVGSWIATAGTMFLLLSVLVFRPSVKVETEPLKVEVAHPKFAAVPAKYAPDHIASVVRMDNGCSAVVVCQGPKGCVVLTADHCVKSNTATFRNPTDGSTFTGTLVARDKRMDVAMFKGEPKAAGTAGLATSLTGTWDAAGYTKAGGIKYKTVTPCPNGNNDFHVTSGPFGGGDSGGGVFVGGRLAGIISACEKSNLRTDNRLIYPGCTLDKLTRFVRENCPDG